MDTSLAPTTSPTVRYPWLAVSTVGLATFSVVTTEMLPVGLLTTIADALDASIGAAGLMISMPALLAAFFAPLVVIFSGGIDRRRILSGLLTLLVIANAASALAPTMHWLLAARVLVGFCVGGIWAIAGSLAIRLVPSQATGLATSIIFGGPAAATVLGVPLGALIGDFAGWRWAFGSMAALSGLALALHLTFIPTLPVASSVTAHQFREQLAGRKLQAGLALTMLLVAGHFMAFTFVRPLLLSVSEFDAQWIGALLFAYGIAGIAGNFLAGIVVMRHTLLSLILIALGLLLAPLLFLAVGSSQIGGVSVLIAWGLVYGGVSVSLMTWMMQAAPRAVEVVAALYAALFSVGIALGSWAGGQIVDAWSLTANLWLSAGCAATGLLLVVSIGLKDRWKNDTRLF